MEKLLQGFIKKTQPGKLGISFLSVMITEKPKFKNETALCFYATLVVKGSHIRELNWKFKSLNLIVCDILIKY